MNMKWSMRLRRICITALVTLMLASQGLAFSAEALRIENVDRFNVMLVIDGSGSLVMSSGGTDKKGLRYDAINLFLALLTNRGNQVGAIVFDDDPQNYLLQTGLTPISGKEEKLHVSDQIRSVGTGKDTDIGSALLTAVETLSQSKQNTDRESVVILFSDGKTDLPGNEEAYQASLENKEAAIVMAQNEKIPVYSICLNASQVADPEELLEISNRTNGGFVSVSKPEDLASAFESFYSLIFHTAGNERVDTTFPDSGQLHFDINVPNYGAEEVNIILDTDAMESISLKSPSGMLSAAQVEEAMMSGGDYDVIKLVDPKPGIWTLDMTGAPGDQVNINIIYNVDSAAVLDTVDGGRDYAAGKSVTFEACLVQDGNQVRDNAVTQEYTAELTVKNRSSGEEKTLQMKPASDGIFTCDFPDSGYNSYSVQATLSCKGLSLQTDTLEINFGNTAPDLSDKTEGSDTFEEKVVVTPITGRKRSYDLTEYFMDEQDNSLRYSIVSSQLVEDTAELDGTELKVNTARSRSGNLVVRAEDSQGAFTDLTIHFKVLNLTLAIFLAIVFGILAAVIIGVLGYLKARPCFRGSITVNNTSPAMTKMNRAHAAFRGKLKLQYFMVGDCGMDVRKCVFVARPGNQVEFRSPTPVYVNGMARKKVDLFGTTTIYADENRTKGIQVNIRLR